MPSLHPDAELLNQLGESLNGRGVSWIMLDRAPQRPYLMVNSDESFEGTFLYVERQPSVRIFAICGCGSLYVSLASDLPAVADRLEYLLRVTR